MIRTTSAIRKPYQMLFCIMKSLKLYMMSIRSQTNMADETVIRMFTHLERRPREKFFHEKSLYVRVISHFMSGS